LANFIETLEPRQMLSTAPTPHPIITATVGTGTNVSHIVIDFGKTSFEFNVRYNGSITSEAALKLLAKVNVKQTVETFPKGVLILGLTYGKYSDYGTGNHVTNYWSFYTKTTSIAKWQYSGQGASVHKLTNGSYDGWDWTALHTGPPVIPMST
jgi:hypothetical protein